MYDGNNCNESSVQKLYENAKKFQTFLTTLDLGNWTFRKYNHQCDEDGIECSMEFKIGNTIEMIQEYFEVYNDGEKVPQTIRGTYTYLFREFTVDFWNNADNEFSFELDEDDQNFTIPISNFDGENVLNKVSKDVLNGLDDNYKQMLNNLSGFRQQAFEFSEKVLKSLKYINISCNMDIYLGTDYQ